MGIKDVILAAIAAGAGQAEKDPTGTKMDMLFERFRKPHEARWKRSATRRRYEEIKAERAQRDKEHAEKRVGFLAQLRDGFSKVADIFRKTGVPEAKSRQLRRHEARIEEKERKRELREKEIRERGIVLAKKLKEREERERGERVLREAAIEALENGAPAIPG